MRKNRALRQPVPQSDARRRPLWPENKRGPSGAKKPMFFSRKNGEIREPVLPGYRQKPAGIWGHRPDALPYHHLTTAPPHHTEQGTGH